MTNEELLDVVKMRPDGCTLEKIGEKYGMTASGILRVIRSLSRNQHGHRVGQARMYDQIIYPNIRARMKERGWSMNTLANKTCITRQGLYHILYGDTQRPRIGEKITIAKALDMSVDEAFREEERNDA